MIADKLKDIKRFSTPEEKAEHYGRRLREMLQDEHPKRRFLGRVFRTYNSCFEEVRYVFGDYIIGEEVEFQRTGLLRQLLGKIGKDVQVLVGIRRPEHDYVGSSAKIYDLDLRESTKRILQELDRESGESYSSRIFYSDKQIFISSKKFKKTGFIK